MTDAPLRSLQDIMTQSAALWRAHPASHRLPHPGTRPLTAARHCLSPTMYEVLPHFGALCRRTKWNLTQQNLIHVSGRWKATFTCTLLTTCSGPLIGISADRVASTRQRIDDAHWLLTAYNGPNLPPM
jgi:hypothetical protein